MVVVSFTHQLLYPQRKSSRYPLNRSLNGPHSQYGRFGEQTKSLAPCQKQNHNFSVVQSLQQSLYRLRYAGSFSKKWALKFRRLRRVGHLSSFFRVVEKTHSIKTSPKIQWVTRWHSWLRHCATNRKVAGSIDLILPAALWRWDRFSL
jgi:hypothetical protein